MKKNTTKKSSLTQQKLIIQGGTKGKDEHLHKISKSKKNKDYYS